MLLKNSLNRFCRDIKKVNKKKLKVQTLNLMVLIYCIKILIKKSLSRGGSYIEFAKWIKDKKSTINPKNNDYK